MEVGVSVQTLRNWIMKHGWRRPPGAPRAVPKPPPEKEAPARRLYESGAGARDLAALLSCSESYVHRLANQRGWVRRPTAVEEAEETGPPNPALLAIADALQDTVLARPDRIRLLERALALTLLDAVAKPGAGHERQAELLAKTLEILRSLPEEAPPAACACHASPEDLERERDAIIERLIRRYGGESEEPVDQPVAAAGGTVL